MGGVCFGTYVVAHFEYSARFEFCTTGKRSHLNRGIVIWGYQLSRTAELTMMAREDEVERCLNARTARRRLPAPGVGRESADAVLGVLLFRFLRAERKFFSASRRRRLGVSALRAAPCGSKSPSCTTCTKRPWEGGEAPR